MIQELKYKTNNETCDLYIYNNGKQQQKNKLIR